VFLVIVIVFNVVKIVRLARIDPDFKVDTTPAVTEISAGSTAATRSPSSSTKPPAKPGVESKPTVRTTRIPSPLPTAGSGNPLDPTIIWTIDPHPSGGGSTTWLTIPGQSDSPRRSRNPG